MRKVLTGLTGVAMVAATFGALLPASGHASEFDNEPGRGASALTSWVSAVDVHGDKNGVNKYNSSEKDRRLAKVEGTVTAVSDTAITVTKKGTSTSYSFTIDSATKVIRKFKGTASVSEITVGDLVKVYATSLTDGTAKLIWDKGIWWVALSGKVADLDTTAKTFNLIVTRKEPQTGLPMTLTVPIKVNDGTKYFLGKTASDLSALANDQTVNVRGSWDAVAKVVTANKIIVKQ